MDGFRGLPFRGDLEGLQNVSPFAGEGKIRRIEEVGVVLRSDGTEKERLDVERTIVGRPGEALETAGNVRRIGELAAAVAREDCGV